MVIHGRSSSINVRKVLWTCAVIGAPYEQIPRGSPELPTHDPAFLALNPNGKVPVLETGGQVITESNTICRYLAMSHGRVDLLPSEPMARAQVEMWMDWQATDLNDAWRYAFMRLVRKSPLHTDEMSTQRSLTDWNRLMGILNSQLEQTASHVVGPTFTLADIVLGLSTIRWLATPMDRPTLPAVERWMERLSGQPGFFAHVSNGEP